MLVLLTFGTFFGCPKDRTGLSGTEDLVQSINEVESLVLKMNEVEQRISKIENVTRARGQDEILKLESLDQVRVEVANMRGEMERMQFQMGQMNDTVKSQQEDAQFRLDWLEQRAVQIENALGVVAPQPGEVVSVNPVDPSINQPPSLGPDDQIIDADSQNESASDTNEGTEQPKRSTATTNETTESAVTAESLLQLAKDHLVAGREAAAEAVLNRILTEFPRSSIEPEVRYRLAEAAFNSKQYAESARRFQDVLNRFPTSSFASWSLLRQGECFEAMGQKENAEIFYNDVIAEYPKSKAAKEAKTKLK